MDGDPAHAKRLEENKTFVRQAPDEVLPEEAATKVPQRARQDDVVATPDERGGAPRDFTISGGASRSRDGNDVEMGPTTSNKRPLEPDGDEDVVCDLKVCDELNESNAYVDDADEGSPTRRQVHHCASTRGE